MRITHSRDKSNTNYKLGTVIKDVKSFKDLGITISKDLTWSEHISTILNKANQVLGLIRRTVGTANTTILAYCSLRNEMGRNEMEMEICSLRNGNL